MPLSSLYISDLLTFIGERCCECDKSLTMAGHFLAYLCCTKCRYSTCCSKAMSSHVQLFHTKGKMAKKLFSLY